VANSGKSCAGATATTTPITSSTRSPNKKRRIHELNHLEQKAYIHQNLPEIDQLVADEEAVLSQEADEFCRLVEELKSKWVPIVTGCSYYVILSVYSSIFNE
jgi:hypothetical protein